MISDPNNEGAPGENQGVTEGHPVGNGQEPLELASFMAFARDVLGFDLYEWQDDSVSPFDEASERMVQVSLCTPNGSGKSARVIPTLALGWLAFYPKGRVVITTADGKQLDGQVMPAIEAHRLKFPTWKFIERQVSTPTGGRLDAFTTDDEGRAEGWHKYNDEEGPLLIIVDESKTVREGIFTAIDRCTYNALLLTSSPGAMFGRFYSTQTQTNLGFVRIKAGLADCPHITPDKIARLEAMHGPNSPHPNPELLRSTLHGEFMMAEGEAKFDRQGLDHLLAMAKEGHSTGTLGVLEKARATGSTVFIPDPQGWLWLDQMPEEEGEYLVFCDPNTCEQGEGTTERDNTACGVMRAGGFNALGEEIKDHIVAALHWPDGVKWDSDVLAGRMKLLADWYGHCTAVVEANNFGSALMKELQFAGVRLWQRTKIDDVNPNKQVKLNGFLTTQRSREHWVQKCAAAVREQALICRYQPAAQEFQTFIIQPSGKAEAQQGFHDDWVAGIGIALTVRCFSRLMGRKRPAEGLYSGRALQSVRKTGSPMSQYGACG